jgi:hypothetical protein
MIGQLVTELKTVQLYEDTTVVFWTGLRQTLHGAVDRPHYDWRVTVH